MQSHDDVLSIVNYTYKKGAENALMLAYELTCCCRSDAADAEGF